MWDAVSLTGTVSGWATSVVQDTRFVAQTPEGFAHDADGNLTADGRWQYIWDGENRLLAMETQSAATTAGVPRQRLEFDYDYRNRRIAKHVLAWSGTQWVSVVSTRYYYDEWNLVGLRTVTGGGRPIRMFSILPGAWI